VNVFSVEVEEEDTGGGEDKNGDRGGRSRGGKKI